LLAVFKIKVTVYDVKSGTIAYFELAIKQSV
jgi:hypothetical protein